VRPFIAAALVALVAAGLSVQALSGAGLGRGPRIRAIRPKADAYVSAASRTQNFGRARELKVDSSPVVRSYVLFDVDLRSTEVRQVSLLLYSRTRLQAGYQIRLVGERWRERRITFANAPGVSPNFVASGPLRAEAWKAVDVTSLVSGDERHISFALATVSAKGVEFASRETKQHGPRLVVERQENATTSSTTTDAETPEIP
jgi:hypothetical protein